MAPRGVLSESSIYDYPDASIDVSAAVPADLPGVCEAYQAGAAKRLDSEALDRWRASDSYENAYNSAKLFLDEGALFVRRIQSINHRDAADGLPTKTNIIGATAVARLETVLDLELWDSVITDASDAIYIHRLATHPDYRGMRFGEALLAGIAYSSRWTRKTYLRLDCAAESAGLRRYYETVIGMTCVGETVRPYNGYQAALYEQRLDRMLPKM